MTTYFFFSKNVIEKIINHQNNPGDKIPADGYLVVGEILVDQSSLSGERESIKKISTNEYEMSDNPNDEDIFGNQECYRGTIVDDGEGVLKVCKVGTKTYYGKIHKELNEDNDRKSPLQIKLSNLADLISKLGYIGAFFIALSFLFKQFVMDQGYSLSTTLQHISNWQLALQDIVNSVILAIIIIVVAVPEGKKKKFKFNI